MKAWEAAGLCLGVALTGCMRDPDPRCDDEIRNGDETGVDCGGATCRKCAGGRACQVAADCFSGACDPGTRVCSSLATVSFADEVRYPSGFKSYAAFAADLDGDGDLDLAVVNEYGSSVSVFRNDHDRGGAFTHLTNPMGTPRDDVFPNFGPTGGFPTGGAIADLNRDGTPDVVTANFHGNSVSVLLNDGSGALDLAPTASYATLDKAETANLAVGDLDHDGNPDVVATNPQRASVSVFLGRAGGTLDPAINLPVGASSTAQPFSVAIGDFDGDGKNDLAIAEQTTGMILVRLGNGDATFQPEVAYPIGGTRDHVIIARDLDLDGHLDLLSANRGSDDVSVLLGRGDGTFRPAIVSSVGPPGVTFDKGRPWFGPFAIAVGDVNQDGVPDVVTPNFASDSVSILLGVGDGHFDPAIELKYAPPTDPAFTATAPYGIAIGDFNGDGKPDLATANAASFDLTVRLSTGH